MLSTVLSLSLLLASPALQQPQRRLTPNDVIVRCAKKESELKKVWDRYAYTQLIRFEVLDQYGFSKEKREIVIEVYHTTQGERKSRQVSDQGELLSVQVTPQDMENAVKIQPFSLTFEDLPKYSIRYVTREQVDELKTYVFDIRPRSASPGERYFQGRIWVDSEDHQIVKSVGKAVPEPGNQKFPTFETLRQQIDGRYWFPVWTGADDVLEFESGPVRLRQLIVYKGFQKFGVSTSITFEKPEDKDNDKDPPEPPPQP